MRKILILDIDSLLASYVAARCLQGGDDQIFCVAGETDGITHQDVVELVSRAAEAMVNGEVLGPKEISARVHLIDLDAIGEIPPVDELWHFESSRDSQASVIEALAGIHAKVLNLVTLEPDSAALQGKGLIDGGSYNHAIVQHCKANRIPYRIFRTSIVVGRKHSKQSGGSFDDFLSLLHAFKAEIEGRSPQYFDFHALRCLAPEDRSLNLIPASQASDLLLRIARNHETTGGSFSIVSPQNTSFSDLCERIGIAYGLGIVPVEDFGSLNAIDRTFHERTAGLSHLLASRATQEPSTEAYRVAGLGVDNGQFDEEAQISLFEALRQDHDKAREARLTRFASVPGRLIRKTISRAGGSELSYYIGGTAETTIVFLNALGQELLFWYPLLNYLMEDYRVIIWEPRGTVAPPPPFGIKDQADDLEAVLQQENIETCNLVGWCTGAKVAIDFYLRRSQSVGSMAFLNCTFKCKGSPEEFDTPYEQNLESLCRMVARKPATAGTVMKTFQTRVSPDETELLEETDSELLSVNVLSLVNVDLRSSVLAPFQTEQTTLNYAHQLVDFWENDSRPKAPEVKVPVLLMGAEFDQVVSAATPEMAAKLFPKARHVHVVGANHYCLYDRPDFVADLLRNFFEEPAGSAAVDAEQTEAVAAH